MRIVATRPSLRRIRSPWTAGWPETVASARAAASVGCVLTVRRPDPAVVRRTLARFHVKRADASAGRQAGNGRRSRPTVVAGQRRTVGPLHVKHADTIGVAEAWVKWRLSRRSALPAMLREACRHATGGARGAPPSRWIQLRRGENRPPMVDFTIVIPVQTGSVGGPDDRLRQPEGRRRQDDHRRQPRRLPRGRWRASPRRRPRPPGQRHERPRRRHARPTAARSTTRSSDDVSARRPRDRRPRSPASTSSPRRSRSPAPRSSSPAIPQRERRLSARCCRRSPPATTTSSSTARRRSAS